jgi:hypothetical protein
MSFRPRFSPFPALLVAIAIAGAPGRATAEPRVAATGPYAEVGLGATGVIGSASRHSRIGPAFALRGGIDLFSWASIGARLELESHQADVPPPPEGEYFQLYLAATDARLGFSVGRVALFAEGSLGMAVISTNVLAKVNLVEPGETWSPLLSGGGGLEYQLQNRHYAFGLAGQWMVLPSFARMQAVGGRAYLRYTY